MKTYANKSNAKRAGVAKVAKDLSLDKKLVASEFGKYFDIAGEKGAFYPEYKEINTVTLNPSVTVEIESKEVEEDVIGGFTYCPHCNVHLDNGNRDNECDWDEYLQGHLFIDNKGKKTFESYMMKRTHKYNCMACDEDFGPELKLELPEKKGTRKTGKGLKIEKVREERNGITRPSIGGKCRAIWDTCDEIYSTGEMPMPKLIKGLAEKNNWNINNAIIELYQWRKFNGIVGRQK